MKALGSYLLAFVLVGHVLAAPINKKNDVPLHDATDLPIDGEYGNLYVRSEQGEGALSPEALSIRSEAHYSHLIGPGDGQIGTFTLRRRGKGNGKAASVPPKKLPTPVMAAKPTGNLKADMHKTDVIAGNHRKEDAKLLKTGINANRADAKSFPKDAKADHQANVAYRKFAKADRKNDMASIAAGRQKIKQVDGGGGGKKGGH